MQTIRNHQKDYYTMHSKGESFPHLSHAPIVEAVIDIRARSEKDWNHEPIKENLIKELSDYPKIEEQRIVLAEFITGPQQPPKAATKEIGLKGYMLRDSDNLQVAQFQKEGYSFSRLKPYENWDTFTREANRLWNIHKKILSPSDVSRLGVRFINRIEEPLSEKIVDILNDAPKPPGDFQWSFKNFFHRDIFDVPDTPYKINFIRLLDKSEKQTIFIIDIDVYILSPLDLDRIWSEHLNEMRYLKNKVFFSSIKESILVKLK